MATSNATTWPVYGQEYRLGCSFRSTTGVLITGWTSASATAYPDSGAGVSVTIAESPANSGVGYIDVPAAQMECSMLQVAATVSNTNATAFTDVKYPVNLSKFTGRFDAQPVLRLEQLVMDIAVLTGLNGVSQTGAALSMLNADGSKHFAGVVTQGETSATRSIMQ